MSTEEASEPFDLSKPTPTPAGKHFPCSQEEVDSWIERINSISTAVTGFLNTDEKEEAARLERRQKKLDEEAEAARTKVVNRYDPRHFARFEDDALIEKLLKEVEAPPQPVPKTIMDDLTEFEKITLEESKKSKQDGNMAFVNGDYQEAFERYSHVIGMDCVDKELILSVRNNRAQVCLKLDKFVQCCEDATEVLAADRHNTKALLRRATALYNLHKPVEALRDVEKVLVMDDGHIEAKKLNASLIPAKEELKQLDSYVQSNPEDAKVVGEEIEKLLTSTSSLLSAIVGTTGEDGVLVLPSDADLQKAEERVVSSTIVLGESMDREGPRVLFRQQGAAKPLIDLLKAYAARDQKQPGTVAVMASAIRVAAGALKSPVTLAWVKSEVNEPALLDRLVLLSQAQLPMVAVYGLQLLSSLAADDDIASAFVTRLSVNNIDSMLNRPDRKVGIEAMVFCDVLLRYDGAMKKYSKCQLSKAVMSGIQSPLAVTREAAVSLLLRATTDANLYAATVGDSGLEQICKASSRITWANVSEPRFAEGILSILYNATLQVSERAALIELMQKHKIIDGAFTMLVNFQKAAAATQREMISAATRAAGLISNSVKSSSAVQEKAKVSLAMLLGLLKVEGDNVEQLQQHVTLICAALALQKVSLSLFAEHTQLLLSLLGSNNIHTVGNSSLIIGALVDDYASNLERADCVEVLLSAIKRLRTRILDLERDNGKGTPVHTATKGAQKNVAIALSKCCRTESMLIRVRELNGIEILYTTLDKGSNGQLS